MTKQYACDDRKSENIILAWFGPIIIITRSRISVQLSVTFFHHLVLFRESLKSAFLSWAVSILGAAEGRPAL